MTPLRLAEWATRNDATILAALGLAALHYADPSRIYDAIRERYPERDFDAWIADVEATRERMRAAQDGPKAAVHA